MDIRTFIQTKVLPPINKMQSNIYIASLTESMMKILPVTLGISIISLLFMLPIPAYTNFIKSIGLYDLLNAALGSSNVMSVFFCLSIAYTLAEKMKGNCFASALISLFCFLTITPNTVEVDEYGTQIFFLKVNSLSTESMITAILIGMLATTIFIKITKKGWTIKFPESVPSFVSDSFALIPPSFITIVIFIAIRGLFALTPFGNFTSFIYTVLQAPLAGIGDTLSGHIVLMLVTSFLWWCGIHGTAVTNPIVMAAILPSYIEIMMQYMSNQPVTATVSYVTFFIIYLCMGGTGCIIGLAINLAFFTKSERYKIQGRLSLVPSLFNISEPLMYGTPVCFNTFLFIPWMITPVVIYLALYFCIKIGLFAAPLILTAVSVLPGVVHGFLAGGLGFGIFVIVACVISTIIYFPFVKIMDKKALAEERG